MITAPEKKQETFYSLRAVRVNTLPDGRQVPFLARGEAAVPSVGDLLPTLTPASTRAPQLSGRNYPAWKTRPYLTAKLTIKT